MQPFYKLIFVNHKFKGYRKLAAFLFLINGIAFFMLAFRSVSISNKIILFTCSFLLLIYSIYTWAYKTKKERSYIIFYLLMAVVWMTETPFWYFGLIFLLMTYLQFKLEEDVSISLSAKTVTINRFFKKEYEWSDFNNIVLKDDLLTIDFSNNKIFQAKPDWIESLSNNRQSWNDIEDYHEMEKEFNEFCKQQLNVKHQTSNKS